MRLSNSLAAALLLIASATAQAIQTEPASSAEPSTDYAAPLPPGIEAPAGALVGTSGHGPARYDQVGFARLAAAADQNASDDFSHDRTGSILAAHRSLPVGSYAEVTAIDTGRTILVFVERSADANTSYEIDLSPAAGKLLGLRNDAPAGVRVRRVSPSAADAGALANGRPASPRLDAPSAMLGALRAQLPDKPSATAATISESKELSDRRGPVVAPAIASASAPAITPPASPPARPGTGATYLVQIGAFGNVSRARALAAALKGYVEPAAGLNRVRIGPFGDAKSAERARDEASRRGYGDAKIIVQPKPISRE